MEILTFQEEYLRYSLPEVRGLWVAHWKETEGYRDEQGYDPDDMQYLQLEAAGMFVTYTARTVDKRLMGHIGFILHKSRHTRKRNAVEDYFYLRPEARKGLNAVKFLRFAIDDLTKRGCCQIGMSSKLTNDIEPLLKRVGFQYVAKFFTMNVAANLQK